MADCNDKSSGSSMAEESYIEKKYGGIATKKPLISKACNSKKGDHERAYFDSADWVLGKQAANSSARAAIESLKPKLKRTPHHQLPPSQADLRIQHTSKSNAKVVIPLYQTRPKCGVLGPVLDIFSSFTNCLQCWILWPKTNLCFEQFRADCTASFFLKKNELDDIGESKAMFLIYVFLGNF